MTGLHTTRIYITTQALPSARVASWWTPRRSIMSPSTRQPATRSSRQARGSARFIPRLCPATCSPWGACAPRFVWPASASGADGGYCPNLKAWDATTCCRIPSYTVATSTSPGLVVANATGPYADLFWALRGAGQTSYRIITSIRYRVFQLQTAVAATVVFPNVPSNTTVAQAADPLLLAGYLPQQAAHEPGSVSNFE